VGQTNAEILLHPVRLRIVLAFGSERLTTAQLAQRLPDIAHATLYRQVGTLEQAGLLEVVAQRRIRGGVERTYALAADAARLGPDDVGAANSEELLRGFVVFAGALIEAFGRYLDDPASDPSTDPVAFRQAALWVDEAERAELVGRLRAAIEPYVGNEPARDRERLLLNTILIPDRSARPPAEG
jgi:DNA-binding transcriptional ArsR family regulator